jgi:Arc/MetJ family transcription regulator
MELDFTLLKNQYALNVIPGGLDLDALARQESIKEVEVQAKVEAVNQAVQRYRTVLAQGERLLAERSQFRAKWATQIQANRYGDMAFRIFRNDALGKYKSAFDLAAKAYDYETALTASDTQNTSGSDFLSSIVRARSLGAIQDGVPLTGGTTGDSGLADVMARMNANWNVLKGRFGFNNPDNEYNEFSLRAELFRIASPNDTNALAASDTTWRNTLWNFKTDKVLDLAAFRRYCLPFTPVSAKEPALVIPFSSYILARKNFFGNDMAGGDSSYDSSHFATKIRSVGVFFKNFNNAFGGGLNNTPRVYLVPAGLDVQRSPTDSLGTLRSWRILDQALPVPYDLDVGRLSEPDWIPLIDEVAGGFAAIRKYASFRAYHDSGDVDSSQLCSTSRLVGRSVWNTQWLLIIPASTLHSDTDHALEWFINGVDGDGNGVKDIKILFQTYSYSGN